MVDFFDEVEIAAEVEAAEGNKSQEGNSDLNVKNQEDDFREKEENTETNKEDGESTSTKAEEESKEDVPNEEVESLKSEITTIEQELQDREERLEDVGVQFSAIKGLVEDGGKDGGDPLAPLFHIVELAGGDVNAYVDSISGLIQSEVTKTIESMEEYGDKGADLHFKQFSLTKKNEMASISSQVKKRMDEGFEASRKFGESLKSHGITSRAFNNAKREMAKEGHENVSNAEIIQFATLGPHFDRMSAFAKKEMDFSEMSTQDIDALAGKMAQISYQNPNLSDKKIAGMAVDLMGFTSNEGSEETKKEENQSKSTDSSNKEEVKIFDDDDADIWSMAI